VETDIEPETLVALVPNLILQPLVENAIRHGISRQSAPGRLAIRAARRKGRLWLQVEDNGPGLTIVSEADAFVPGEADAPAAAPGDLLSRTLAGGVGLANTRARLEHLYGADGCLTLASAAPRGMLVTLEIPFQVEAAIAELAGEVDAVENYKPELARIDRAAGQVVQVKPEA
jgi:LytS/YehU family sensor histidine kinase